MPLHTKAEKAKNKAAKVDGKTGPAKTVRGTANRRISDIQKEIDRLTKTKKKLMSK
jgi:hypothetical protein